MLITRDREFGPGLIKICSAFPYPAKVWPNGHEWAKRQAAAQGITFSELVNGFANCSEPGRLQANCDRLGPAEIQAFFEHWLAQLPTPLGPAERKQVYWWELSMRQIETSRTLVLDAPQRARGFFASLISDNLDLGRPGEIQLIFARQVRKNTCGEFSTKVVTRATEVRLNRNSRFKQYLKQGRAMRLEVVSSSPDELGCQR